MRSSAFSDIIVIYQKHIAAHPNGRPKKQGTQQDFSNGRKPEQRSQKKRLTASTADALNAYCVHLLSFVSVKFLIFVACV
jgi:hypothetical protein